MAIHTSGTMKKLVVALFAILALSACATPDVDQTVANFDEEKFAEDLNNCRGGPFIVASVKGVGNAVIGSAHGAFIGLLQGTSRGDSAEGAAIGAIVGATLGFGVGAHKAYKNEEGEIASCLRSKGYTITGVGS